MLNLKSFFIFLSRNKGYTFINLFGLSVSLMFVLLIANYVVGELTVDKGVEKADRIFVVGSENSIGTGFWNGQKLYDRYPEIENYSLAVCQNNVIVSIRDVKYDAFCMYVDTAFLNMFSVKVVAGNPKDLLASTNDVVVSHSFARKAFGDIDPIGKSVRFEGKNNKERTIVAVVENFNNSVFQNFDILVNSSLLGDYNGMITSEKMEDGSSTSVFLLAREGNQDKLLVRSKDMADYFRSYFWVYQSGLEKEVKLIPFKEIYYSPLPSSSFRKCEPTLLAILIAVGALVLLFAVVNYINLTTAQTGFRAKEMATRRLIGSSRAALFGRLIMESFIVCSMAFILGFLLAISVEPYANSILHSRIDVVGNISWAYMSAYLGAVVLLSVISGVVPAYVISNFKPIEVVRGSLRKRTSMVYSRFLIAFQNIIAIALVGGSITMLWQVEHLINAPLGYTYENIIDIGAFQNGINTIAQVKIIEDNLNRLPCVEKVGLGFGTPFVGVDDSKQYGPDKNFQIRIMQGDSAYFKMLGIRIKKDHHPSNFTWYFNEYAFKMMGKSEDETVVKFGANHETTWRVGGVLHDFKIGNMLTEQRPCAIGFYDYYTETEGAMPNNILVKINGDPAAAFKAVSNAVQDVVKAPEFDGKYIADQLKESYAEQRRVSTIMLVFTGIAILISMLGLLAMSTYYIQQRKREVAVRKIFGSTSQQVLLMLTSSFMKIVGIAFVIAVPIIWYAMDWWLSDFAYRISLSPLIFVGAGAFASLIALATVYWQSRRAADANPIDAIK